MQKVQPDILYVLGKSFRSEIPVLQKDIRALDPQEIVIACKALNLAGDVKVLEKEDLGLLSKEHNIALANDEVMRYVADTYLKEIPVTFENIFLRWDKMAAVTAHPVTPTMTVSKGDFDRKLIGQARKNAQRSSDYWRQVGAVIVKEGEIILEGYNKHQPTENAPYIHGDPRGNFNAGEHIEVSTAFHGEASLIARAAQKGISLEGASIYVTTFPCPNCSILIIHSGIKAVYYADGYSNLNGEENLKLAGVQLIRVLGA